MSEQDVMVEAARTATVVAAWRSGMLAQLERAPASAAEMASSLGLHEGSTELVLDALEAFGLVERCEGGWRAAERFTGRSRGPSGGIDGLARTYTRLPEMLVSGEASSAYADEESGYREVTPRLGELFARAADALADALGPTDGPVLDVGAGSAVWSLAMIAKSPGARAFALDRPGVLEAACARAKQLGLEDRIVTVAGDLETAELAAGTFARIVVANVLHLEAADGCARLVSRLARALRPGGELVVVDVVGTEPANRAYVASYALHLRLRRARARVHPADEIHAWLHAAGLDRRRVVSLDAHAPALGAIVGATSGA